MLELVLVLVIISTFVLGGMQFYQLQQQQLQVKLLLSNVDFLFTQLANYYLANCRTTLNATAITPKSVTFTDLGITASNLFSSYLVDTTVDNNGYSLTLTRENPSDTVAANTCVINGTVNSTGPCTTYTQQSPATGINWQFKVGVKFRDSTLITRYQLLTGADASTKTGYLSWNRSLSTTFFTGAKVLSPSLLLMKQFGAQYTHNQYYELDSISSVGQDSYYMCGG